MKYERLTRERRYRLLDQPVDLLSEPELTSVAIDLAVQERPLHIAHVNLNSLVIARRDLRYAEFYERASVCPIDGMPVVWMARLCGIPARHRHRVTYVDWIWPLMSAASEAGLRVFFLGSRPGVGARAAAVIRERISEIEIGYHHGYFDAERGSSESLSIVRRIRRFDPQLLLVGMGMPRQERWILDHREQLPPCLSLAAGACADFLAGEVPTPPRWAGAIGLEWLFRLCAEPRRLCRRYLIEPWQLRLPLVRAMWRRR